MLIVLGVGACNALSQNANSVTLAWDPNPEPDIAGYILYYGPASGVYSSSVTVTNAATCSVSNLLAGVTYFFAVTAYDAAGLQSDPSNEISYTVPAPSGAPSLDPLPNLTVSVDAGPQHISLGGISAGIPNLAGALVTVTAISSNPDLIPDPVVHYSKLRGTGTLIFTTAAGMSGLAIVTVTASVGLVPLSISRSFTITVAPVNHAPLITGFPDFVTTDVNKPITLAFHVSDLESAAEDLLVTAQSLNEALIPSDDILREGTGTDRTVTLQPLPNEFGLAIIRIRVLDPGGASASTSFTITVAPVNHAPLITGFPDSVTTDVNKPITLAFHVSDLESAAEDLLVIAQSLNEALIPSDDILLEGTGTDRTMTLQPLPNEFGLAIIRIRVLDPGGASASTTLELGVNPVTDPVPPLLRIGGSGKITTLSWPASALGFQLEASDALIPPAWNPVDATVRVVLDRNVVTVALPRSSRFFRLRKP